jgi:hypothetical protein
MTVGDTEEFAQREMEMMAINSAERSTENAPFTGYGPRAKVSEIPTLHAPRIAVFISCSDSRHDVLERVLPSILKFWPDCPYPIFVGTNSPLDKWPNVTSLLAKPQGWRAECLTQVARIQATHLIVILDDFLFQGPVDQDLLSVLVSKVTESSIAYLRLLPMGKSLRQRVTGTRNHTAEQVQRIEPGRPFYSCLQIAIWKKQHFESMLKLQGSIWDFEHQRIPKVDHYSINGPSPFAYRHIVEKGRWLPDAKSLLRGAGLPSDLGTRPRWPKWAYLRLLFDHVRFLLLGYANH